MTTHDTPAADHQDDKPVSPPPLHDRLAESLAHVLVDEAARRSDHLPLHTHNMVPPMLARLLVRGDGQQTFTYATKPVVGSVEEVLAALARQGLGFDPTRRTGVILFGAGGDHLTVMHVTVEDDES